MGGSDAPRDGRRIPSSRGPFSKRIVSVAGAVALVAGCESERREGHSSEPAASAAVATAGSAPRPRPRGSASAASTRAVPPASAEQVELPAMPAAPQERADAKGPLGQRSVFSSYGIPPHPRVVHLCGDRIHQAAGGHRTWDAFVSVLAPADLIAAYRKKLGSRGFEKKNGGGGWRLPPGGLMSRSLQILPPGGQGPHRRWRNAPGPDAASVLILTGVH